MSARLQVDLNTSSVNLERVNIKDRDARLNHIMEISAFQRR